MATKLEPDAALMLRVKRGDMRAFEELVEKYKQPVVNVISRTLHDQTEAEDLAQNVFVQVFKSAHRYQATAKFSTWLFTIARNLCLNEIRRRSRHPAESLEASQTGNEDSPARQFEDVKTFSPTENVLHGELEQKVQSALADVPFEEYLQSGFIYGDLLVAKHLHLFLIYVYTGYVISRFSKACSGY